jgi:hypothetical protein
MRRHSGRRILLSPQYVAGFASAMATARTDLFTMSTSHQRDYAALRQEVETLRTELAQLRALAGVRDPTTRLN